MYSLIVSRPRSHLWVIGWVSLSVLSSCGQGKKVIQDIALSQTLQDQQLWVEMDTTLAPSGFTLPSLVLPLRDPQRPERNLGEVETSADHIVIRVNVTEATKLPIAYGSKLPNGTAVPIVLNGARIIGIPIANSQSMVYVALSGDQLMLGAAIGIRELSTGGSALNIFLPVQISNSISGLGGLYLGSQSGVGVFATHSKLEPVLSLQNLVSSKSVRTNQGLINRSAKKPMALNPSELTRKKLERLRDRTSRLSGQVSID